ncbi:PnbA Carboxylesterase type B [Pyrenophora tritici-repentis]|uniref:Carboxylic ester hydrolase n=1 Tax=Pyrenophora tritici-repentis TaxID=45151 RepID=A0A2W1ESG7_9PLEO|nr:PnbA Carboxylesterase type B [Pyrenophora tritici-repentis]KAF7443833.1 PnbA Carboxylesterase type B [Pyrenophora tritici-repentis]KAF7566440.1 PnbA, Carboxylesterase type B [Pyrenophora tritici-repentis]KAG9379570.1 PnbA Carboxylesterase type B [Pyrenophora tritici-repentis]KAI0581491.1 PnbA Carboxylesterase type B [Pyrenophora tritici-repentis]
MLCNVAVATALFVGLATSQAAAPTAQTQNGTYVGLHSAEYDQDFFLGIPYAQPPVGSLRFRNPVALNTTFSEPKPATQYSSECYGYGSDQWNYPVSEDCLYINIVRPAGYEDENLPVSFWIHGGGFTQGGGIDQRYNLSFTVQNSVKIGKPIIGVSINYRLSAWGFLAGSEELKENGNLNLGLRDQRLALQWVQENIGAFGGNPEQVTIYGESAGAQSVGFHLTAYGGRDDKLFRGAIMQSGNPVNYGPLPDPVTGYTTMYNLITSRTGCANATSPLECLRGVPTVQLNAAINTTTPYMNTTSFQPCLDGDFIQKRTSLQLAAGEFVHVPIISGANSDEGTAFSPSPVNSTEDLRTFIMAEGVPANLTEQLLVAYPDDLSVNVVANLGLNRPDPLFGPQFRRSASYFGDYVFIANRRLTCQTWAAANVPAYCYRFNVIPAGIPPSIGVTHFQEVAFVFNNLNGVGYLPAAVPPFENKTESYRELANFMNSNWISFVHDLDPNAWRETTDFNGTEAMWPVYDVANPMDFVFDANVSSYAEPDTYRKEGMALINAHNYDVYMR